MLLTRKEIASTRNTTPSIRSRKNFSPAAIPRMAMARIIPMMAVNTEAFFRDLRPQNSHENFTISIS